MFVLALESSAKPVSVSLLRDGAILASAYENEGLTHSVTLMPMVARVLSDAGITVNEVDWLAAAAGPGSFTGLRIGAGTLKGLAWAAEKPCAAVSTLLAMACLHPNFDGIVCPAMDARRSQVYTALFDTSSGSVRRLAADEAIGLDALMERLAQAGRPVLFVGDGAVLAAEAAAACQLPVPCSVPAGEACFQHADGVALAAWLAISGQAVDGVTLTDADRFRPAYLRLAQAEREKLEREQRARGRQA